VVSVEVGGWGDRLHSYWNYSEYLYFGGTY